MDDFDKKFNRISGLAIGWFVFVALLMLSLLGGGIYVVIRILMHFGIL